MPAGSGETGSSVKARVRSDDGVVTEISLNPRGDRKLRYARLRSSRKVKK